MAQPLGQAAHRALPLGIVGGFLYLLIWMGKQTADVQLEREKEAIIEASKTPEQRASEAAAREAEAVQRRAEMRQQFIGLHLGDSVGMMYGRGHVGGVPQGQHVELAREDASKNIITFIRPSALSR